MVLTPFIYYIFLEQQKISGYGISIGIDSEVTTFNGINENSDNFHYD